MIYRYRKASKLHLWFVFEDSVQVQVLQYTVWYEAYIYCVPYMYILLVCSHNGCKASPSKSRNPSYTCTITSTQHKLILKVLKPYLLNQLLTISYLVFCLPSPTGLQCLESWWKKVMSNFLLSTFNCRGRMRDVLFTCVAKETPLTIKSD